MRPSMPFIPADEYVRLKGVRDLHYFFPTVCGGRF
jgi:hypothetical protein